MARRKKRETFGSIRRLPSGRYQASYRGPDRQRHTAPTTFETLTPARVWLASVQSTIAAGAWQSPESVRAAQEAAVAAEQARMVLFANHAERWLSTRHSKNGKPLAQTTKAEYRRLLAGPLADFAEMPVATITEPFVRDWHNGQLARGKVTQTARAYALLSSVLKDAVSRGFLDTTPCTIKAAASQSTGRKVTPPTDAELAVILSTLDEPYRSLVLVAAWSGLRFGELTELRGRDVMIEDGQAVIHVSRGVTHTGEGAMVGTPKSDAGVREVVLPRFVTDAIRARLRGPDDLLWHAAGSPDRHLRQSTVAKRWIPARAAAGRPDLPFHGLRHHAVSKFALAGATEAELLARNGHANSAMVRRYSHDMGRQASLVERMG